jgi:nicotinamide mononucleotide (NMN) deamidase PncC
VGTVWFGIATPQARGSAAVCELQHFAGDREQVRRQSVDYALRLVLRLLRADRGR